MVNYYKTEMGSDYANYLFCSVRSFLRAVCGRYLLDMTHTALRIRDAADKDNIGRNRKGFEQ